MRRIIPSPLGPIELKAADSGLTHATFLEDTPTDEDPWSPDAPAGQHLALAARELEAYFNGSRVPFSVTLDPAGTDFQRAVWRRVNAIPPGHTATYGQIARSLGNEGGSQAVGAANADNPILIIIPCHRVVGADGHLTGYAAGVERKRWLLRHESAALF